MQNRREITDFPAVCEVIVKVLSQQLLTASDEVGEGLSGKESVGQKGEGDHLMEQFAGAGSSTSSITGSITSSITSTGGAGTLCPDLCHYRVLHIHLDVVHLRHGPVEIHSAAD